MQILQIQIHEYLENHISEMQQKQPSHWLYTKRMDATIEHHQDNNLGMMKYRGHRKKRQ